MTVLRGRLISVKVRKRKREGGREGGPRTEITFQTASPERARARRAASTALLEMTEMEGGDREGERERWGRGVPARAREAGPALGE